MRRAAAGGEQFLASTTLIATVAVAAPAPMPKSVRYCGAIDTVARYLPTASVPVTGPGAPLTDPKGSTAQPAGSPHTSPSGNGSYDPHCCGYGSVAGLAGVARSELGSSGQNVISCESTTWPCALLSVKWRKPPRPFQPSSREPGSARRPAPRGVLMICVTVTGLV